ncbi:MAG: DUF4010 domain-containing protein, partial [Myxococcaceae bacterium]|nr:DUF4010 domain-containing protein [Myxococcaceae bacterium]MCI0672845.1 DUF4010 domain-containing protein [Myxococcaceae bacterium]
MREDMDVYEPFLSLGLALAAGLLIGFEREASAPPREARAFLGGARTHPLFSLVGAVSTLLTRQLGVTVMVVALLAFLTLLALAFIGDIRQGRSRGLTSDAAFLLSFLLGALAMAEGVFEPLWMRAWVVGALAVTITGLLSLKPTLHAFVQQVSRQDILAALKLLVLAVVFLPLLPDRTFGPLDVLNPFNIGLFAVFIAGLSFTGYVAIRMLGPRRGLGLTGALGGLASSTAVALSFSGRARREPALYSACALAVVLASTIMFPRVLVVVAFVAAGLVPALLLPMGLMTLAGLAASLYFWRRASRREGDTAVELRNPFRLKWVLGFALLFA